MLIGTSFAFFSGQKTELESLSAQLLLLDDALAQYGPETQPARDKLKTAAVHSYETFWGGGEADPKALSVAAPLAAGKSMKAFLATLEPKTDAQKQALAAASSYAGQMQQSRLMMSLQVASHPVGIGLVVILTIWAIILFFGFGIFAQSNRLIVSALVFGALCVAFAVFLVLELGLPYTGMFRVSPASLQEAIANIDQ
jgi:hypothetical protein